MDTLCRFDLSLYSCLPFLKTGTSKLMLGTKRKRTAEPSSKGPSKVILKIPLKRDQASVKRHCREAQNHVSLQQYGDKNVLPLLGVSSDKCALVFPFTPHGDLATWIHTYSARFGTSYLDRIRMSIELARLLASMHEHNRLHRNLHASNILVFVIQRILSLLNAKMVHLFVWSSQT